MLSIIINVRNSEKYLEETITSVLSVDEDLELIIIDNNSQDGTSDVVGKFSDDSRLRYIFYGSNMSLGEARNEGLKLARKEYLTFIDSDDIVYSFKIIEQPKLMQSKNLDFSFSSWVRIDEDSKITGFYREREDFDLSPYKLISNYRVNFQTMMFRTSFLRKNRIQFNANFKFGVDYELFLKIVFVAKWGVFSNYAAGYRIHDQSMTSKNSFIKYKEFFVSTYGAIHLVDSKIKFIFSSFRNLILMLIADTKHLIMR